MRDTIEQCRLHLLVMARLEVVVAEAKDILQSSPSEVFRVDAGIEELYEKWRLFGLGVVTGRHDACRVA